MSRILSIICAATTWNFSESGRPICTIDFITVAVGKLRPTILFGSGPSINDHLWGTAAVIVMHPHVCWKRHYPLKLLGGSKPFRQQAVLDHPLGRDGRLCPSLGANFPNHIATLIGEPNWTHQQHQSSASSTKGNDAFLRRLHLATAAVGQNHQVWLVSEIPLHH